jgi:DNA-directed RNA polymerase specialized sigma24 family protein
VVTAARRSAESASLVKVADDAALDERILTPEPDAALHAALAQLPARCQQLLAMLSSDPPRSYAEISVALRIPIGSIGPQRTRCLNHLRRSMALADPDEGGTGRAP